VTFHDEGAVRRARGARGARRSRPRLVEEALSDGLAPATRQLEPSRRAVQVRRLARRVRAVRAVRAVPLEAIHSTQNAA